MDTHSGCTISLIKRVFEFSHYLLWVVCIGLAANAFSMPPMPSTKFIGNIVGYAGVPNSYTDYWQQVTPETAGFWQALESRRDYINWTYLDTLYNYSRDNNLPFTEYAFITSGAYPAWFAGLNKTAMKEEYTDFAKDFCLRYPLTEYLVVVNEPLRVDPLFRNALQRQDSTDEWDWVIHAYEIARQYCPKAKLTISEYGIFNNETAAARYKVLVQRLVERNLLDVVGVQAHSYSLVNTSVSDILLRLDDLASTGLPIYITGFDLEGNDDSQLQRYQGVFPLLYDHNAVIGITIWGYIQGQTWRDSIHLLRSDGSERPALTWLKHNYDLGCAPRCVTSSSSSFSSSSSSAPSSSSISSSSAASGSSVSANLQCNWYGTLRPICTQQDSNWGWENNRSCIGRDVCPDIYGESSSSSTDDVCHWYGTTFPYCEMSEDGFGWEEGRVCIARKTCL